MKINNNTNLPVDVVKVIANPTLAGNETALNGIEIDGTKYKLPVEIFWVNKGTTTYVEITAALNANKIPVVSYSNKLWIYSYDYDGKHWFSCVTPDPTYKYSVNRYLFIKSNNNWEEGGNFLWEIYANSTLTGTENYLTSLQVGNTKYKVPSGDKLYAHYLYISNSASSLGLNTLILTSSDTAFTPSKFLEYLYNNNLRDFEHSVIVSGRDNSTDKKLVFRIYCNSSSYGQMSYDYYNATSSTWGAGSLINVDLLRIHDTVIQVANTINVAPDIHLYEHNIYLQRNFFVQGIYLKLYNSSNTQLTTQDLLEYLNSYGPIAVTGIYQQSGGSKEIIQSIRYYDATNIQVNCILTNFNDSNHNIELNQYLTITDTVRQIL